MFVASLGVTALLGMMALLMPSVPYEVELLATSGLLTAYSLLGLGASLVIARGRMIGLAWTAVIAMALSLADWLMLVWFGPRLHSTVGEAFARIAGTLTILGLLALHAVLLSLPRLSGSIGRITRAGTVATAICGAGLALLLLWNVTLFDDGTVGRLMAAMLIPAALGTIAAPVLARIEQVSGRQAEEHTLGRSVPVHVRCPRCALEQEIHANRKDRCAGCGLEMTLKLAEPRCQCGYLLYGLREPVCPECGREVGAERWWQEAGTEKAADAPNAPGGPS